MNINLTLIVQMFVFATLIWVTMKFDLAADSGRHGRAPAQDRAGPGRGREGPAGAGRGARAARRRSSARRASAPRRSSTSAASRQRDGRARPRARATPEGERLVAAAQQQIELDTTRARESLRKEVAGIAVGAAAKLLGREIDAAHARRAARQARHADLGQRDHGRQADHRQALRPRRLRAGASDGKHWTPGPSSLSGRRRRWWPMRAWRTLLGNPHVTPQQLAQLFIDVGGKGLGEHGAQLRAHAGRERPPRATCRRSRRCSRSCKDEAEGVADVTVTSAAALDARAAAEARRPRWSSA